MPVSQLVARIVLGNDMDKLLSAQYRKGVDSREQSLYTVKEAAYYLGIEPATLRTWFFGRRYETISEGQKLWNRVIVPADPDLGLLSFFNLAEAHILAATRYRHKVPFPAVRDAIANLVRDNPEAALHPLLSSEFFTNGKHLFTKTIEDTLDVSREQLSFKAIMDTFLERVINDDEGHPYKVFPLVENEVNDKVISIVAGVSYSRPIIEGTGVPVSVIWGRYNAGEDPDFIAKDFEIEPSKIHRAIKYVERRAA